MPRGGRGYPVFLVALHSSSTAPCVWEQGKEHFGYPVQNNSQGYEWFFVPRTGCIFVDGDSPLTMPVIEPQHVCAVYRALGHRFAWLIFTQP